MWFRIITLNIRESTNNFNYNFDNLTTVASTSFHGNSKFWPKNDVYDDSSDLPTKLIHQMVLYPILEFIWYESSAVSEMEHTTEGFEFDRVRIRVQVRIHIAKYKDTWHATTKSIILYIK